MIIASDINIQLDVATDQNTVKFVQLRGTHGLTQHVTGATHRGGHCLDVLITTSDLHVLSVSIGLPMLSDHSQIVAELDLRAPQQHAVKRCTRRAWRSFDYERFVNDLCQSTLLQSLPSTADALFDCYNTTLQTLIDVHAPRRLATVRDGRSARWYDQ